MTNEISSFAEVCKEADDQMIETLIETIDAQPTETLKGKEKKQMHSFLKSLEKNPIPVVHHGFSRLAKVAIAAIIILSMIFVTAMASDSFRDYIIKSYYNGTELIFNGTSEDDYIHASYDCHLKGYRLVENKNSKHSQHVVYSNEDGAIIEIETDRNGAVVGLDTEHGDLQKVDVNGNDAFAIELEEAVVLTWSSGRYTTCITADTDEENRVTIDDLIRIAESRKKVK